MRPSIVLYVSGEMNATMQDVDIIPEHLHDGFVLGIVTITDKSLDVTEEFKNKREEAHKRIGRSVSHDPPGQRMHGLGLIPAQHRHDWKHESVRTRSVVDEYMNHIESL